MKLSFINDQQTKKIWFKDGFKTIYVNKPIFDFKFMITQGNDLFTKNIDKPFFNI